MTKTYVAIEAKTGAELFSGGLKEWDNFFHANHTRLGTWVVKEDSRSKKVVHFSPLSPAALIAFLQRTAA